MGWRLTNVQLNKGNVMAPRVVVRPFLDVSDEITHLFPDVCAEKARRAIFLSMNLIR